MEEKRKVFTEERRHCFGDLRPGAKFIICNRQGKYDVYCQGSYLIMCKLHEKGTAVILNSGQILQGIEPNLLVQKVLF